MQHVFFPVPIIFGYMRCLIVEGIVEGYAEKHFNTEVKLYIILKAVHLSKCFNYRRIHASYDPFP